MSAVVLSFADNKLRMIARRFIEIYRSEGREIAIDYLVRKDIDEEDYPELKRLVASEVKK